MPDRIILLISAAILGYMSAPVHAQSSIGQANLANNSQLPSFVDGRPVPQSNNEPDSAAMKALVSQQQQQIKRLSARADAATRRAERATLELKKQLALNTEIEARRIAAHKQREADLRKQRDEARNLARLRNDEIKQLQITVQDLQTKISAAAKERDKAQAALSNAMQTGRDHEAANQAIEEKLAQAIKAQRETEQSLRAVQLASQHEQDANRKARADLAKQNALRHEAEQALRKAKITIATLTQKLKQQSSNSAVAAPEPTRAVLAPSPSVTLRAKSTQQNTAPVPPENAVAIARRNALAEARRRVKAARERRKISN